MSSTCEGSSFVCSVAASSSRVAASVAVTTTDAGVKSGAALRISAMEMTTSAPGLASGLGFAIATLMFLMFGRPHAKPANMHNRPANKNLDILISMDSPNLRHGLSSLHRTAIVPGDKVSKDIVLAAGRKDIDHNRIFYR